MSIQQEKSGGVYILGVSGRLDQEQTPQLEELLNSLFDSQSYFLVVDLTEASYINSGGLRTLVSAWRKSRQSGGTLVLSGLSERLREIFNMVGFDKVFDIYETVESASEAVTKLISGGA